MWGDEKKGKKTKTTVDIFCRKWYNRFGYCARHFFNKQNPHEKVEKEPCFLHKRGKDRTFFAQKSPPLSLA